MLNARLPLQEIPDRLTFFLWHGGLQGTTCNPVLAIDNIRIVPIG